MPKTRFQKRILSAKVCTVDDVLDEIGARLEAVNAYPPILPIVGTVIRDVVRELREVEGELSDESRADDGAATSSGS